MDTKIERKISEKFCDEYLINQIDNNEVWKNMKFEPFTIEHTNDESMKYWFVAGVYLHGQIENLVNNDLCSVIGEENFHTIITLKEKRKQKVNVYIDNKEISAILYIWKNKIIRGIIVEENDSKGKEFAEKHWNEESRYI